MPQSKVKRELSCDLESQELIFPFVRPLKSSCVFEWAIRKSHAYDFPKRFSSYSVYLISYLKVNMQTGLQLLIVLAMLALSLASVVHITDEVCAASKWIMFY